MARRISEIAAVIIGSIGRKERVIACKLGHSVGRVLTIEAIAALKSFDVENAKETEVILGERNEEMNGTNGP